MSTKKINELNGLSLANLIKLPKNILNSYLKHKGIRISDQILGLA